jgi:hypothetical protein
MPLAPAANEKKEERKKTHPRLVGLVRLRGLALSDPLSVLLMILGYVPMGNISVRGKFLVLALRPKSLRRRKKPMLGRVAVIGLPSANYPGKGNK